MDIIFAIGLLLVMSWWTKVFLSHMKFTPKTKIKDKKVDSQ